jgi:opacity protein-like surface antigen
MKALKILAVVSVLSSSASAQSSGLFINAGGGIAKFDADEFTQRTSYGEVLRASDTSDDVGFVQLGLGYRFDEKWDAVLSYADYDSAEIGISYPKYPNIASILPLPAYSRNVLKYETSRLSLAPAYTFALSGALKVRASAGMTWTKTDSHNETMYRAWFSGPPSAEFSDRTAPVSKKSWSWLASIGLEYAISEHFSVGLGVRYSPFKVEVAPTPIVGLGPILTQPSKGSTEIKAVEAMLSVTWRR